MPIDPKTYMAKDDDEPATNLSIADLVAALKAASGNDDESMQKRAKYEAEAWTRLNKRENDPAPMISVFNPRGDRDHPRPELKCKMEWVGYPLDRDSLTADEIALLNAAEPGEFTFHRTDGSPEKLTVTPLTSATGRLEKLSFYFPCRGDNRHNLPGLAHLLQQVQGKLPKEAELYAQLEALRAELETVKAGAAA